MNQKGMISQAADERAASAGEVTRQESVAAALAGLSVRYGNTWALRDVTLSVEPGAVYALLGRNGAGKSSAVRCWLGQQRPSAGRAVLLGRDAYQERTALMLDVGVVPEQPDAPPRMTANQLSEYCAGLYPRWDGAGYRQRLERYRVPLDVLFQALSRGQRSLVMLASALAHQPKLLVLDDPTLGLDAVARRDVFTELIDELHDRGTTVIITSHDLEGIERIATHVAILRRGELVIDGALDAVKDRFRALRIPAGTTLSAEVLRSVGALGQRVTALGEQVVVGDWSSAAFAALRQTASPGASQEASPEASQGATLSLEELFVAVASEEASR